MPTAIFKPDRWAMLDQQHPASWSAAYTVGPNGLTGSKGIMGRALLRYNVLAAPHAGPAIGAGANVTTATLLRSIASTIGDVAFAARVERVTRDWTMPNATWNTYDGINNWTTAGGDTDDPKVAYDSPVVGGVDDAITGLVELVTDAIANRAGLVRLLLRAVDETVSDPHQYNATGGNDPAAPPFLLVTFEGFSDELNDPDAATLRGHPAARAASPPGAARPAPPATPARPP